MRIRVESEGFTDDEPGPPEAVEGIAVVRDRERGGRGEAYSLMVSSCSFFLLWT